MTELRILFTSVGRRVELVQAFHKASIEMNKTLKIYGADVSSTAPALKFCDELRIIDRISNPNYIPNLLKMCREDSIDLLIPTIDTDLLALSEVKGNFTDIGTKVLISEPDIIRICRDKRKTQEFFNKCGVYAPDTFDNYIDYNSGFPCFVKPRDGSSSVDAYKVNNTEDLDTIVKRVNKYVIQPFIDGQEFTVDILCDFDGKPIFITPRERLAVRSGEVLKTKINLDKKIISECAEIINEMRPCGPITIQLIRQKDTNKDFFIEINPRFGGGSPLSIKAGADSAKVLLQLISKEEINETDYYIQDKMIFSRFDQSVCVNTTEGCCRKIKAVIFDLDDTLYSEKDYVRSGYQAIADENISIMGLEDKLWNEFLNGNMAIDVVLKNEGIFSDSLKQKLLNVYRNHLPKIKLYEGINDLMMYLKEKNIRIGIITDGRVEGQKAKFRSLQLDKFVDELIITDALAGNSNVTNFRKPNKIAFEIMARRLNLSFEEMAYVGDNPKKDFKAPKELDMRYLWLNNHDGLNYVKKYQSETFVVNSVSEMIQEIKNMIR